MKKQKIGVIIFWFGVLWSFVWGIVVSVNCSTFLNTLTMEQLDETIWSLSGSLMFLWGIGGVPMGVVLAGIGLLLYTNVKNSTILIYTIGILLAIIIAMASGFLKHFRPLFGIGGSIILLLFFGILWFWAKERRDLKGSVAKAADLKLVGYVFMLFAAWFTCGMGGQLMAKAFEGVTQGTPLNIMIFFVLGWFFLFLGHYQTREKRDSEES